MPNNDQDHRAGPWRLDLAHERLCRGTRALRLRPKTFAVLRHLVAHPDRLLSKDELVQAVWADTAVSDGVLAVCIAELRKALGDTTQTPRYIETVPRRGYRWVGPPLTAAASLPSSVSPAPFPLVGRDAAGAHLHAWFAQARRGSRQIVFITGEVGLGKTTVVDAFLAQVADEPGLRVGRGQCIEHYGVGEAYLPVLDTLRQLARRLDGERLVAGLTQHAPIWLVQMPGLLSTTELEAVQRRVLGATRERMLRELADALEALTAEHPMILVLEDLHWSDAATLDLVGYLARRRAPARLLLLATYRPIEVMERQHPLRALQLDLALHRQCQELALQLLTVADVERYLASRFGDATPLGVFAQSVHRRTEGHPLFLVTMVDELVRQGVLQEIEGQWQVTGKLTAAETVLPEGLQQMIAQQFDILDAEAQRVLESASVAGLDSAVAAVAAGIGAADEAVEAVCAALAERGKFLRARGVEVWPDGTMTARYGFRHTLYQQVVYERVPPMQRLRLHCRIGTRLETGYGAQGVERAAELAMHFDRGRLYDRAVPHWRQAALRAQRRWAYPEAIGYLQQCLESLHTMPATPQRAAQELDIQLALGQAFSATRGPAGVAAEHAFTRAEELCRQVGGPAQRVAVLRGLRELSLGRGDLAAAEELSEEFLALAEQGDDPALLLEAHVMLGLCAFYRGDAARVCAHVDRGLALDEPMSSGPVLLTSRRDLRIIIGLGHAAMALWVRGYPDQARERIRTTLERAQSSSHPWSTTLACLYAGIVALLCGNRQAVEGHAEVLIRLATEQELALVVGQGLILHGWAVAMHGQTAEGLAEMGRGRSILQDAEQRQGRPFFLALLAEQYGQAGQAGEGLDVLAEAQAIAHTQGLGVWEAELHRLKGVLLHQAAGHEGAHAPAPPSTDAERPLRQALDIARRQGAKAFELRAAMSLARLWMLEGNGAAARHVVAEVYDWFTEGFGTKDLRDAVAMVNTLRDAGTPRRSRRASPRQGSP